MEALISDLTAHNIQNRRVAIIENGSWAATSGGLIRGMLAGCKNIDFLENIISIRSGLKELHLSEIESMADAIAATFAEKEKIMKDTANSTGPSDDINPGTMFKLSYGLFVLTAKDGEKDNGCIINTAIQITQDPLRISIAGNKANYTHDMIVKTGRFNVTILSQSVPFKVFQNFGFQSGRNTDKFADCDCDERAKNGILYVPKYTNGMISAKVIEALDYGTHTVFIADVTQALVLSAEPSVTYQYYFDHIKPKPQAPKAEVKGFVCKICGYVHEGETLPDDFICPLCKHGAADFEPL